METPAISLPTAADLEAHVRNALCERDRLDPRQAVLFRAPVARNGRTAAWLFHIRGPRASSNSAIWSPGENRILLYDSTGKRFREIRLSESPAAEELAKAA